MGAELKTVQSAVISQNQILSARILAMNNTELSEYLSALMEENPVLDMDAMLESIHPGHLSWSGVSGRRRNDNDGEGNILDTVGQSDDNVRRSLRLQLKDRLYSAQDLRVLEYMIECIDDDGYMTESAEYIEERFGLMPGHGTELLNVIQGMSPCGVGARNVRECILLQLRQKYPEEKLALTIAESFLEELAGNRLSYIAKKLRKSIEETARAAQLIKCLSPRPCAPQCSDTVCAVVPDVTVTWKDGRYQVFIDSRGCPRICISSDYRQLAESTEDKITKKYISEKYRQASWVASCITQRETTLKRISEQILCFQRAFFHIGPQALCALTQKQIAEAINLHESTVSRALRNKYLLCKWGTFPMEYFFSENMPANVSSGSGIHAILADLIAKEDKRNPLTDQELAECMRRKGADISRRTIAKYRSDLNIPSSAKRKVF